MPWVRNGWITLLLTALLSAVATSADPEFKQEELSSQSLERRLEAIDEELADLAHSSLRSGVGSIGYRSIAHDDADSPEWVEVTFDRAYPIDEIIIAPTLWRDSKEGFQADGFPEMFRVVAGTGNREETITIASYNPSDHLPERVAPVVIPANGTVASWIRIEATQLSRRAFDSSYVLQVAELMAFSGARNVALRQKVAASSVHVRDLSYAWDIGYLVDGHMPYLMDAADGEPSVAYIASVRKHPALILDLGKEYPISEIHLHAVDQSDTVPQAYPGNLGIPPTLVVEGAKTEDFSDSIPLLDLHLEGYTATGPVMMWPLPETVCRYVRIRSADPMARSRFGFAEIEVFSKGENVALNQPVFPERPPDTSDTDVKRPLAALTDGRNLYGHILPLRTWMTQLSRRHDLEVERPVVVAELTHRYERQKRNLQIMYWVAAFLAASVAFIVLIDRMLRMRQATKMRERFAADLHDELGANIHTIGLLGDLARDAGTREELLELLDRSRLFTERSGATIRNWTKKLEARGVCEDLVDDMRHSSTSILADLDHEFLIEGEEHLDKIKPRKRIYIFLFYKECLTNLLRHSGATKVITRLRANPKELKLEVIDNGIGLNGEVPLSLKRRARLLRTRATSEDPSKGGACVTLELKIARRFPFLRT